MCIFAGTMGIETERKFLLKNSDWKKIKPHASPALIRQGYLNTAPERTVRVRVKDKEGFLTIKGLSRGFSRPEFEYPVPLSDAESLLQICEGPLIEKTRHYIMHHEQLWEIDVFFGDNEGLILAEAELEKEDQVLEIPEWIGPEVTQDKRYYNSGLSGNPFRSWKL